MSEFQILTVVAGFAFAYSLVASRLEKTRVSGALVYVAAGFLCGPVCLGWIRLDIGAEGLSWLAEITLAVVLFTDSSNANLKVLRSFSAIPTRLLLVGLPLTILLGFGVGVALFGELSYYECALLATMLAATDAALGKAVVTNKAVPESTRESLNVESGLNDGICVPVILLFLALARGSVSEGGILELATGLIVEEIGIGAVVGIVFGAVGGKALHWCADREWITGSWLQIPVVALAMLCFALAGLYDGSGFIACFVGGMTFGIVFRRDKKVVLEAAEGAGDALALLTWFAFGALLFIPPLLPIDVRVFLYAVASLTLVRMVPVFLCVSGEGLRTDTKLFLGWFGPRGLASIVFAVMVAKEGLPGGDIVVAATAATILLSILVHGISANPLAKAYGNRVGNGPI